MKCEGSLSRGPLTGYPQHGLPWVVYANWGGTMLRGLCIEDNL